MRIRLKIARKKRQVPTKISTVVQLYTVQSGFFKTKIELHSLPLAVIFSKIVSYCKPVKAHFRPM
jgi:hypothetical protein